MEVVSKLVRLLVGASSFSFLAEETDSQFSFFSGGQELCVQISDPCQTELIRQQIQKTPLLTPLDLQD